MINKLTAVKQTLFIFAMIMSFSMIFLNESGAIGVAFPQMQLALNLSNNAVHWVMNAFLLTAALLLLLGGKLADHYGCRRIFLLGVLLFGLFSTLCASTHRGEWMIIGRIGQAIGASLAYPSGGALLSLHFNEKTFAKVYGTVLGFAYIFVAFGPFIGGLFTDFLTWRWLFWINIFFSVICLSLTLYAIPKDPARDALPHLDLGGLILWVISLGALVTALMQGATWGWGNAWTISLFMLAGASLVSFVWLELRQATPLLPVRLFANSSFMAGNLIFASVAACFTSLVFWAIWLQHSFAFSPLEAGIAMIPATVISIFMLGVSGAWGGRVGPRTPMLIGAGLLVASFFWIAFCAHTQNYFWLFWGLLGFGFATPLIIPNSIGVIMNSVQANIRGSVAGIYLTLQHVAFALGFAMLSAIITTVDNRQLHHLLTTTPMDTGITHQQVQLLLAGKNTLAQLNPQQLTTLKQAAGQIYSHAFADAMIAMGIVALIILSLTLFFIPKK